MARVACLLCAALLSPLPSRAQPYPFNNASLPASLRAADLLSRLTLAEKVGMLYMDASMAGGNDSVPIGGDLPSTGVPRLGVPQFNWMGQGNVYRGAANGCDINCCTACPPGRVGRGGGACCHDGVATQLPQGTGIAASFNADLVFRLGVMASDESWGIQNGYPGGAAARLSDYRSGASSVVNIMRDGRWGRSAETLGECPVLTGAIAVALNKGLAGFAALDAPAREYGDYWKVVNVVRHFVGYAGPDAGRFSFNAVISDDDLALTYLPAWRRLVSSGALGGVMSAISACNGVPSAAHGALLSGVLRGAWGFDGFVISDCDTVAAIATSFRYTATVAQAAVAALRAGGDINCGPEYELLLNATIDGLADEAADIDPAVLRVLLRRVQSGDVDAPPAQSPYAAIPYSVVDSPPHRALARQAARESVVLLRNDGGALPLRIAPGGGGGGPLLRSLLVVGPSADDPAIQAHTYHGTPAAWVTVLAGLRAVADASVNITYVRGCGVTGGDTSGFAAALAAAAAADAVLYVGGLQASLEEEDTDRADLALPGVQLQLIQALRGAAAPSAPVVVLVISGGPVSEPWLATAAPPFAWAWASYFGQDGGGIADVLAGLFSPSGRLPFTMPVNTSQLGDIGDYDMRAPPFGRTYRYLQYGASGGGGGGGGGSGFTELAGVEIVCAACLTGWPSCDNASVPGQCSWPRPAAVAACAAWPACGGVTCNSGRDDCQARAASDAQQPAAAFTSYVRGASAAAPLFPFAWGLSYANASASALALAAPVARLGDTVALNATVVSAAGSPATDYVVALFGAFAACDGSPSPVAAAPLRTLLAFAKASLPAGGAAGAAVVVPLAFVLDDEHVPGASRQPLPGQLMLWAGDAGACAGCPTATLALARGATACGGGAKDEL